MTIKKYFRRRGVFYALALATFFTHYPQVWAREDPEADTSTSTVSEPVEEADKEVTAKESVTLVDDIQFVGNTLNKSKALEKKIKTRRKKPLDKKQLNEDVKALFEMGDFEDVG